MTDDPYTAYRNAAWQPARYERRYWKPGLHNHDEVVEMTLMRYYLEAANDARLWPAFRYRWTDWPGEQDRLYLASTRPEAGE